MKLSEKDNQRLNVVLLVINKEITQHEAALKLGLSDRQFRRILKKYKEHGPSSITHKNVGQPSHNKKISKDLSNEIINDYLKNFFDFGFTHFYEERGYKYGISFSSMVNIFLNDDIISPFAQHKTIKSYNENIKKAMIKQTITEPKEKLFKQRKQEQLEKHIRKATLHYSFGQEIQMDAAFWIWFGEEVTALHLSVDKATNKVLSGYFDYEETTMSYLIILMNMIINFGIPEKIRTDKRNSFALSNGKKSKSNLNTTQFGRICQDLGIILKCSSDPLFKPNVERENGTFKRRLKAELRYNDITDIKEANKYLNDIFIPKMNERFSYDINPKKNVMRKNNYTIKELNFIISIRYERTIDNASSVKYYNNYYLPINYETGEVMSFRSGTKCIVVNTYDNKLFCIINKEIYLLLLVEKQERNTSASKNGFKPADNHPWRSKNRFE